MGSASSKAATRVFPKRAPAPWAGARASGPTDAPVQQAAAKGAGVAGAGASATAEGASKASEKRTADIEQDAGDPDFLRALNRLGPVTVDHGMGGQVAKAQNTQRDEISRLFQSRAASEDEASSLRPSRNHLYAAALHELLNARKAARTRRDLEKLAETWNMDVEKLEGLARVVNSVSVDSRQNVKVVDKNGDETVVMTAVWVNSPAAQATS